MPLKLKLTNREKKLLIVLGVCLVAALLYYAVIKPQLEMVSRLEEKARDYSITIKGIKEKANPDNPAYKEYSELYQKTQALLKPFYPSIIQEKLILTLEKKIKESKLDVKSINFMEPDSAELKKEQEDQPVQANELEALTKQLVENMRPSESKQPKVSETKEKLLKLDKMTAVLNFEGSYNEIYSFIKSIEQENRSIVCSSISVESNESGLLTGVITLDFYSIPKPFIQDQDYLNWDIEGVYGKTNPFGLYQNDIPVENP